VIEMMGYYGYGTPPWMWAVGILMMLVFSGGLAALIVYGTRALTRSGNAPESAEEILRRRLAAGQISPEDYERTRKVLDG
jgi:uncharacterized membrane protein